MVLVTAARQSDKAAIGRCWRHCYQYRSTPLTAATADRYRLA